MVEDSSGGRIASATVRVEARATSLARETTSDSRGEFRLDDLLPGRYQLSVSAKGFSAAHSEVTVVVSSVRDVSVTLKPEVVQEKVTVLGSASSITTQPINLASAVNQAIASSQDLDTIPLAARSFANIAYLAPGTEPVEPSDPTKARITAVSTGGSSGLNNELSVDGGDNSDDYIGGFLQNFSPDAIQEFAVRTSQEEADTGRTTAASVVITTKRGTDQWHGTGAFYERAASLNARFPIENPAPNPKQPFSRQNYVGTIGGPIRKQKIWFFSAIEYVHENASVAYSPASQTQFNALAGLAADGLISGIDSIAVPNSVPVPLRDYLGLARFDWAQSEKSQWFLRAAIDNYVTHNALVQQGALPSTGLEQHNNYLNMVIGNQYLFSPSWLGSFVFDASGLHLTEARNSNLGFALAFPFTSTSLTISGFETFGDNQFQTPITAFPVLRNQEKYQLRYDVTHSSGRHAPKVGINFIHEPVLSGALSGTAETLISYPSDPDFYAANPSQFYFSRECAAPLDPASGITCTFTPAGDGSFSQDLQRLGIYAQDSWRLTSHLTVNYGLRYDTTFGLVTASGRSQSENPAYLTLKALDIPLINGVAHDYRKAFGPRLGIAYAPGRSGNTVIRAGFGLFYDDLAQNGWVTALQAVNAPPAPCVNPGDPGCIPGGGTGDIIAPNYRTPYALHATAGVQHAFSKNWTLAANYVHEQGNHGYRAYNYIAGFTLFSPDPANQPDVPNVTVFKSDNRSSYNALMIHLQGNATRRFSLVANYTLSRAKTWGCVLGELFDYVNGVCNPLNPFGPGDYGPSGEDVTDRFVLAGTLHVPGGFELTSLFQAETGRPITLTTPVDVNGFGDPNNDRAVVNGVQTTLDQFRGTPYIQADLRVTRPFTFRERWSVAPFVEFFNLFNRNNPGANYVTDISVLPVNSLTNVTGICTSPQGCPPDAFTPITSFHQLLVPAGALGDFFGPGTTVGIPFAAQLGVRVTF
ncbi:MAG TPA: carboxypeptidase regulatory-like domain-containing protein [Terriglobales bacterium]|nr:carboxypeptidase regulatory-like domain-containing protein [Terriglobales bacterium]